MQASASPNVIVVLIDDLRVDALGLCGHPDMQTPPIDRVGQLPQVRQKMLAQGIDMLPPESPAAAQKLVRQGRALWLPVVKCSGASAE